MKHTVLIIIKICFMLVKIVLKYLLPHGKTLLLYKIGYMASTWTPPEFSREEINKAGKILIREEASPEEIESALVRINNWRTAHNFPLNTFQIRLRKMAKTVNENSLVAQRIKRLPSIKHKLERFHDMKLSQIQDIGGCRAIMKSVNEVDQLVEIYLHGSSGVKHVLAREQDYIKTPKTSGYRGVHLVYKYKSDKNNIYEDLKIEIQIRTVLQHAWATAVETVGTFIRQSLKSSQGEENWLQFFVLMSSIMAIQENKPIVEGTSDNIDELKRDVIHFSNKLDVEGHLTTFRNSLRIIDEKKIANAHYYLLELDAAARRVFITPYTQKELTVASRDYIALEERITDDKKDAVLVAAESLEALKLAFPNYYLDTDLFLEKLKEITG